ncbi:MAG: bacillithiol system redox-active protein YtxJ [Cyclobacteriaceae bacterium]|nr:bacillithiol system redox-active protein YtxJ [Cyclobacteriaceae bacterium]
MNWFELTEAGQLEAIRAESHQQPVMIFKHSTRCSISRAVLDRVERNWNTTGLPGAVKPYFLDLIAYRSVSNQVAAEFDVEHESPQAIVICQGKPVYAQSHFGIDLNEIKQALPVNGASKN